MVMPYKKYHDQRGKDPDGNGRYCMGIEDLQKLNVAGDQGNEVSFVSALQFGRTEPAKGGKYFMADDRQQFKGNIMIARLLSIMEDPPCARQDH